MSLTLLWFFAILGMFFVGILTALVLLAVVLMWGCVWNNWFILLKNKVTRKETQKQ